MTLAGPYLAAPGLCAPTTQESSTALRSGLRKQIDTTFRKGREKRLTRPLFTKWKLSKANRHKTRLNKVGTHGICNLTNRHSRQNPEWSSWRAPLLISEEAVFGTREPQILVSKEKTQGRFGCPQFFSGSSVEIFLSLRDNLRLSPHKQYETTSSPSNGRLFRKRTWETFNLSHCVKGLLPDSSPERKRRKMNFLYYTKVATTRASQARTRPCRKRTWDAFVLSRYILRRVRDPSSPARKKMKMSLVYSTRGTREWDTKKNSLRKRKWRTFLDLHSKSKEWPSFTSPKSKKIRIGFNS